MKKKQWIALAIALVLFVASLMVQPRVSKEQEKFEDMFSKNFEEKYSGLFGEGKNLSENIVEEGDPAKRVLVLELEGAIMDTQGQSPFGTVGYNHTFFMKELEKVLEDDTIKAILFKVNSPGGAVYESSEIRNKLLQIKKEREIPIYVSMENMAASGGYWVSADADKIFAAEETLTGSIGVIMQSFDYSGLMEKYGVRVNTYKSGPNKDMGSPYKPATEEEQAIFTELNNEIFARFVNIVAQGRNLPEERVREIADGRVYTAYQAKALGLVDEIGFPEDALNALLSEQSLEGSQVFKYENSSNPFSSFPFSKSDLKPSSDLTEIRRLIEKENEGLKPMIIYGGN